VALDPRLLPEGAARRRRRGGDDDDVVAVAAAIAYVAVSTGTAVLVALLLIAAVLVGGWLKRLFTTYTITDRRLHIRRGIVARAEQQTQINRVQNVNTRQSVLQRMLFVGTVDFDTAAGDDYDFTFAGVASPHEVVEAVHRAQREADTSAAVAR
jgi:uncharacterized membrane protein YdbT with pleckstrin-like domain